VTDQQTLRHALSSIPLRAKLQLSFLAVSISGFAIAMAASFAFPIWVRFSKPMALFDPRLELCHAVSLWGFVLMAAGLCGLAFVHGNATPSSRLSRYGGLLFWASVLAMLAISKVPSFAGMSVAEVYATALGKLLVAGGALGLGGILISLALDLVGRLRKAQALR
jgi:hypothetical protein